MQYYFLFPIWVSVCMCVYILGVGCTREGHAYTCVCGCTCLWSSRLILESSSIVFPNSSLRQDLSIKLADVVTIDSQLDLGIPSLHLPRLELQAGHLTSPAFMWILELWILVCTLPRKTLTVSHLPSPLSICLVYIHRGIGFISYLYFLYLSVWRELSQFISKGKRITFGNCFSPCILCYWTIHNWTIQLLNYWNIPGFELRLQLSCRPLHWLSHHPNTIFSTSISISVSTPHAKSQDA